MPSTATSILDGLSTSVAVKAPVRAVSTVNLTLSGLQTVNGVVLVENDRVLVRAQTTTSENGIYSASTGSWIRTRDFDGNRDVRKGTLVIDESSTNVLYRVTAADPIIIGTSAITFEAVGSTLTQADIAAIVNPQTAAELSAGVTPVNFLYAEGHVLRYGTNTTPGTTDMTTAFQSAALVVLNPYAPAGLYLVTGSIPLRDNQHWTLDGACISITGTTVQVFTAAAGIDDWSITGGSVIGDNGAAGATSGSAAGIKIVDSERWRVVDFTAQNIKGWGILVQPGSSTSDRAEHGTITNFHAYACYRGVEVQAGTGAEYVAISGPYITRCNIGAYLAAGNVNVNGGNVSDNTDGFKIGNGSNHAHATIVGVNINHNTQYNVHCDNVVNGQSFIGCHIYGLAGDGASAIFLDQCKGILFSGGEMDCDIYNYKGASSGINKILNMYCPGSYGLKRVTGSNNGHDELIIQGCWGAGSFAPSSDALDSAGVNMNDPSDIYVLAKRAPTSTQSLTSGVAADLVFNTEVSDRRGVYNNTTGVTTIPAERGGFYRIRADLVFSGTGMSATASVVELKVNGTSLRLYNPSINSTTRLAFAIATDVYLNAADAVKLTATITGTTPVHGDATYESSLTVERLS